MSAPKCPICHRLMTKHGKTKAGKQRWRCKSCNTTKTHTINSDAKQLKIFWIGFYQEKGRLIYPRQLIGHSETIRVSFGATGHYLLLLMRSIKWFMLMDFILVEKQLF